MNFWNICVNISKVVLTEATLWLYSFLSQSLSRCWSWEISLQDLGICWRYNLEVLTVKFDCWAFLDVFQKTTEDCFGCELIVYECFQIQVFFFLYFGAASSEWRCIKWENQNVDRGTKRTEEKIGNEETEMIISPREMRKYENWETIKWWQEINRKLNTANPLRRTSLHGRPKMCVHKILTNSDMPFNPPPFRSPILIAGRDNPPFSSAFFVAWIEVTCACM